MNISDIASLEHCDPIFAAIGSWIAQKYSWKHKCIFVTADGWKLDFDFKTKLKPDHDYTIDLIITDVTNNQWRYDSESKNRQQNV